MRIAKNYLVRETIRVAAELGMKERGRPITPIVKFTPHLEFGALGICYGKSTIYYSTYLLETKEYYKDDALLEAIAFHEVAHMFVPSELSKTGRRTVHHGKAYTQFCVKYGHHPVPWADANLIKEKRNH
jgi:hypothetical protein